MQQMSISFGVATEGSRGKAESRSDGFPERRIVVLISYTE